MAQGQPCLTARKTKGKKIPQLTIKNVGPNQVLSTQVRERTGLIITLINFFYYNFIYKV